MATNDHFSSFAATYAEFRPSYPDGLFRWLAEVAPARNHAWDCATGNGQAAISLARHFARVTATDVGAGMIAAAQPHPRVNYSIAPAESPPADLAGVDLITVAQALHWFDRPRFWATCRQVLRPGGVLAYWGYLLPEVNPTVDALIQEYHDDAVGPFWPPGREPLLEGYASIQPEGARTRLQAPIFTMCVSWTIEQLIGQLASWSATNRCRAATGTDPLANYEKPLRQAWGAESLRTVSWPLHFHAFSF